MGEVRADKVIVNVYARIACLSQMYCEFIVNVSACIVTQVMARGMVLVMSLWDDTSVNMLWLDSVDPPTDRSTAPPGAVRGPCSIDSGVPSELQKDYPGAFVTYGDIKVGVFGSTYPGGTPPTPPAPSPPGPPAPPTPGACPGGNLTACMGLW